MAEVWRVEDRALMTGPCISYKSPEMDALTTRIGQAHTGDHKHPTPGQDRMLWTEYDSQIRYGCPTARTLVEWFEGFWAELFATGFQVVRYTVPDDQVWLGDSGLQVAFYPMHATREVLI